MKKLMFLISFALCVGIIGCSTTKTEDKATEKDNGIYKDTVQLKDGSIRDDRLFFTYNMKVDVN